MEGQFGSEAEQNPPQEPARRKRRNPEPSKEAQALPQMISDRDLCRRAGIKLMTWREQVRRGDAPKPEAISGLIWLYRLADVKQWLDGKGWPSRCQFKGRETLPDDL